MASIYKNRDKWRCQITVNGKRKSKSFATKKEAFSWAAQAEREISILTKGENLDQNFTVKDLLERYMEEITANKASKDKEIIRLKRFIREEAAFVNKKLSDIKKSDVDAWIDRRLKEVSEGTLKRELNIIKHAFRVAIERWEWIEKNPFVGSKIIKAPPPRDRILSWFEIRALLKIFKYNSKAIMRTKTQEVGVMLMIALRTGMRIGEIVQLGRDNVDFKKYIITIKNHKTFHHTGKPRIIPFNEGAYKLLKKIATKDLFFTANKHLVDSVFRKKRDSIGLSDIHFHDSRATALTILSKCLQPMDLAKVSGHKNLNILLNVYYREKPEDIALKMRKSSIMMNK